MPLPKDRIDREYNKFTGESDSTTSIKSTLYDPISDVQQSIDEHGHALVTNHGHIDNGTIHLHTGDLTANTDIMLVDLSDTVNYPHSNTGNLHINWLLFYVDASNNARYDIQFGFLDNVDATNGDFIIAHNVTVGQGATLNGFNMFPLAPNGLCALPNKIATSTKSLNDTAFNTATNMRTTLSPVVATTSPANGDLILRIIITAGTIDINFDMSYHGHV